MRGANTGKQARVGRRRIFHGGGNILDASGIYDVDRLRASQYRVTMPLYLVRWPDLSACIVRARNEGHLDEILDELDDPSDCQHWIYNGPLWIEFELPVTMNPTPPHERMDQPLQRDQIAFDGIEDFLQGQGGLKLSIPCADTSSAMERTVMERCFPAAAEAMETALTRLDDLSDEPSAEDMRTMVGDIKEALLRELDGYIAGSWRATGRRRRT